MRSLGISEAGFARLARVTGQAANWQSRFDEAAGGAAEPAAGGAASTGEIDTSEIQGWIDYFAGLQPEESFNNLQAWIEYLNAELETLKAGVANQMKQPDYPDYGAAEDAFSGQPGAQQTPQQQTNMTNDSVWNSIKNYFNKDVKEQVPRQQLSDDVRYGY